MPNLIAARTAVAFGVATFASVALAQAPATFAARMSWVPITAAERGHVSGHGTARATLSGSLLSISGSFEGLPGAATLASLRRGVAVGARGPVVADLHAVRGADGTFAGDVELDGDEREALLAGRLYVQLHAEGGVPPDDAVLWGWLLEVRQPGRRDAR